MTKLKEYFLNERKEFSQSIGKAEYASWWLVRLCMVGAIIYRRIKEPGDFAVFIMSANLLATFSIPLARMIFFKKIFLGKLPFRIQSLINVFVFFGSFLGHGFKLNGIVENYDKLIHILSGAFVVFIGYELLMSLKNADRSPTAVIVSGAVGFSFAIMVLWEIFEFFFDYYIEGSQNQDYNWTPSDRIVFFKIFGRSVNEPDIFSVMDTNMDLMCGALGCVIGAAILAVYLNVRKKKNSANEKETVSAAA